MIKNFLTEPIMCDAAVLNAVYFNGRWQTPFKSSDTREAVFNNIDGTTSNASFMNRSSGSYNAYFDTDLTAIELNYGSGNYSMILVKPAENKTFDDLKSAFDNKKYNDILASHEGNAYSFALSLPKFSTRSDMDLSRSLSALGFDKIFTEGFNSVFEDQNFVISMFKQSVAVDVNENGTEAASSTMAGGYTSPGDLPHDPVAFDSPFIYIIRETSTNTILFIGQVTQF